MSLVKDLLSQMKGEEGGEVDFDKLGSSLRGGFKESPIASKKGPYNNPYVHDINNYDVMESQDLKGTVDAIQEYSARDMGESSLTGTRQFVDRSGFNYEKV